jgi:hypothetical protein
MRNLLCKFNNLFNNSSHDDGAEFIKQSEKQSEKQVKLPNLKFSIWKRIEETATYKNNKREVLGFKELSLITFYDENEIFYSGSRMFVQPVLDKNNPNLIMDYEIVSSNEEYSYFEYKSQKIIMEAIKIIKNRVLSSECLEVQNIVEHIDDA